MFCKQLGYGFLTKEELKQDKKKCKKYGPCGVGKEALYLNSFYMERYYYVPIKDITRVFKRIAMSKGGFTGKGIFASIPYLVVEYDDGKQKQCNFKYEKDVDLLLEHLKETQPQLKFISEQVEKQTLKIEEKIKPVLSQKAKEEVKQLKKAKKYLEMKSELSDRLSKIAQSKRAYERIGKTYKWSFFVTMLLASITLLYGMFSVYHEAGYTNYILIFGLSVIFFFVSANIFPTARKNKRDILIELEKVRNEMEVYIKEYPEFPVPFYYAHPIVIQRMIRIIEEGRTEDRQCAFELVKEDLKMLNSSVQVDQKEYDEVIAIKAMFLIENYE